MKLLKILFFFIIIQKISGQNIDSLSNDLTIYEVKTEINVDSIMRSNSNLIKKLNIQNSKLNQSTEKLNILKKKFSILLFSILLLLVIIFFMNKKKNIVSLKRFLKKPSLENLPKNDITEKVTQKNATFPKWVIVSESIIGKSHIVSNTPCQDANYNTLISNDWGMAIVCDGAGSATNSEMGAKFMATEALPRYFKELILKEKWIENNILPSKQEWEEKAFIAFKEGLGALTYLAKDKNFVLATLACTAIVVIYSPIGILVAHIGDGRAAYCDEKNIWHSLITPHKGEESNQTIFLTSSNWLQKDLNFQMSNVSVPECNVITSKPIAFALMSDGCEQHSFECSIIEPVSENWLDPNKPYDKFFNPIVKSLRQMVGSPNSVDMQESWKQFLTAGTEGLKNESDDKTMILGIIND